jgi:hypothetical protein
MGLEIKDLRLGAYKGNTSCNFYCETMCKFYGNINKKQILTLYKN